MVTPMGPGWLIFFRRRVGADAVGGPYTVGASSVYVPGVVVGAVHTPGAVAGEVYTEERATCPVQ